MFSYINKRLLTLFSLALFSLGMFGSSQSYAENSREFGDYVIHYNAFRSDTISPEIAKQHGLPRASNRVLINIAVLQKVMHTTGKPTPATIEGHASNLTGQFKQLTFQTIKEGTAIYYLADTKISDGEFLKFDIKVTPEGEKHPMRLHFDKRFFTY